jgi:hypothetical protein
MSKLRGQAKLKTLWCHKISYLDGYIRSGINLNPEKSRPMDVIRLKIKSKDGTGDCDLQLEPCEAIDIIKTLRTAKKRFRELDV